MGARVQLGSPPPGLMGRVAKSHDGCCCAAMAELRGHYRDTTDDRAKNTDHPIFYKVCRLLSYTNFSAQIHFK